MRQPLVFVQRFPRIPGRVEFYVKVGDQSYSHWYDEGDELSANEVLERMTRELHIFASAVQDRLAATL